MKYFIVADYPQIKTSEIMQECRELFDVYSWLDDKELDKQFPAPKKITIHKFKANIEADENLKNLSADDLKKKKIKGITLRERLLLELQYFKTTGEHLDIDNITLCSGSRYSDGSVPDVYWSSFFRRLYVGGYGSDVTYPNLRAREQFPLNLESCNLGEDMIEIDGKSYSKSTIKETLKEHFN